MVWVWLGIGIFVVLGVAMYAPDWARWIAWNRRRKRLPEARAKKLRPPVTAPFWSSYIGGSDGGAASGPECGPGVGGGVGGDVGGGCD